ncbi:hypothetical protein pEaSNUABM11_00150 [Erwinia phage pEa_SNUABM_11]|nr:hypothetical protein pEaSNUABM11_00150 [Erwinia phage pEa_SNUABM_11]
MYFDTHDRDIVALADSIGMSIPDLYFSLESESHKANVKGFAPQATRIIINNEIHRRAFGKQEVTLQLPEYSMNLPFMSLDDLIEYLRMMASPSSRIDMTPYDINQREIMASIIDCNGKQVLSVISGLNFVQYRNLLEQYKVK